MTKKEANRVAKYVWQDLLGLDYEETAGDDKLDQGQFLLLLLDWKE